MGWIKEEPGDGLQMPGMAQHRSVWSPGEVPTTPWGRHGAEVGGAGGLAGQENRTSHWFDVPEGFALECLVIGEGEQQRVYVVTTAPPAEYEWIMIAGHC